MDSSIPPSEDERGGRRITRSGYLPIYLTLATTPVIVAEHLDDDSPVFCTPPLMGPLLFDNVDSDSRDHCANERTFLSYLRLSMYMTVVSIAIVVSFHLKSEPSQLELRMAKPLGIIFWLLSLACLGVGFGNYMKTVNKYSRRVAIVQTGWKTQSILTCIAFSIVGVSVLFLATNSKRS